MSLASNSPAKSTDSLETVDLSADFTSTFDESLGSPSTIDLSMSPSPNKRSKQSSWSPATCEIDDECFSSKEDSVTEITRIDRGDDLHAELGCFPIMFCSDSEDQDTQNADNGTTEVEDSAILDAGNTRVTYTDDEMMGEPVASGNDRQSLYQATDIRKPRSNNIPAKRFIDFSKISYIDVQTFGCCKKDCISQVDVADIMIARKRFVLMSFFKQKQWILDYASSHTSADQLDLKLFIVQGYAVCKLAWCAIYGIGEKRLSRVVDDFRKGIRKYEMRTKNLTTKHSLKSQVAKAWMEIYFHKIGDKMPDSLTIHLPSYLDRKTLYRYMREDLVIQKEGALVSYSQFCALMVSEFPDVVIPKVNRLTKCDICTVLKDEKEKTLDSVLRNYYDSLLQFHNDLQREEREKYYKHRGKAKDPNYKSKYMCIIVDGMDQSKLLLPSLLRIAKSYSSAWKLKTHLTGVLNHGRENLALVDLNQWPHDSNFTMNVLLITLARMDYIPDYLYLQMDNCWRENKNQFVLTFLAVLVKLKVFKKVKINFLMVGHTHEDVDQLFSRIRQQLFKENIRVVPELLEAVKNSFTPTPHVELMTHLFNIRKWVEPARIEMHNISNPHLFVIKHSSGNSGDVILKYKQWSRDKEWLPAGQGICILKSDITLEGIPTLCEPSSVKIDLARLKADIPKFFESRTFDGSHKKWWDDFLENRLGYFTPSENHPDTWPLEVVLGLKEQQQLQSNTAAAAEDIGILGIPRPPNLPREVEELVATQMQSIPEVYVGPYRNRRVLQERVQQVDDPSASLREGVLVAVHLQGQKKVPVLAIVNSLEDDSVSVTYLKGSWKTPWKTWNGQPWTDTLPKTCILLVDFKLRDDDKLPHQTYLFLKQRYSELLT